VAEGGHIERIFAEVATIPAVPASHAPFAILNRTFNPAMRALLASPAHGIVSRQLALITVTGKRSGRTYTIPVSYEAVGDRVEIPVLWPERKRWWRNLTDGGQVDLLLRGRRRTGRAVVRGDEASGVTVVVELDL
jgi:hypothetical protein